MKKWYTKGLDINWPIAIITILISFFGIFVILSASANLTIKYGTSSLNYAIKQASFVFLGIFAMFLVSHIDYRFYYRYAGLIWLFSIVLILLGLFSPLAVVYNGYAKRGLNLFVVQFMPSDIYKIASIILVSKFLIKNKNNEDKYFKGLVKTAGLILIPTMLIMKQPDLSTSITIIATLGTIYLIGGFRKKFIIPVSILFVLGLGFFYIKGFSYQMDRIKGWLEPEKYAEGKGISWQILNSLFAVSRGGFFGVGYGKSVLKFGYLANEVINDMVFAVIAEEFGFFGSVIFITAVFALFFMIYKEAMRSKDVFAKYLLVGIGALYLYQSIINIGVSMNLIPNTGITLPFISFGGTSIVLFFSMIGIVLNVSKVNNKKERLNRLKVK
ncbi:MAG: FtsW/RodA/SpoVE family cell cycle protein [Tissierellia bacterium]|nr:FtsW/RodA/SpoVE family cell cycle protein [Tissierellia bacterium]